MVLKQEKVQTSEGEIIVNEISYFKFCSLRSKGLDKDITEQLRISLLEEDIKKAEKLNLEEGSKLLAAYIKVNNWKDDDIETSEDVELKKKTTTSGT